MNKKFSTFLVGALLASSMSVVAQKAGEYAKSLPIGNSGNLYQLHVWAGKDAAPGKPNGTTTLPTQRVVVDDKGNLTVETIVGATSPYKASLWCINIETEENGKNPTFDFTNKAYDFDLAASEDAADPAEGQDALLPTKNLNVFSGNLAGWKFSGTYEESIEKGKFMATYFKPDSFLVLTKGKDYATTGAIGVKKYGADTQGIARINDDDDVLRFYIYIPGGHYLTASEYNTVFGTYPTEDFRSLEFSVDRNNTSLKNPFSDYALKAKSAGYATAATPWLNFEQKTSSAEKWLRVDTSYANSVGVKFLNFAFGKAVPKNPGDAGFSAADSLYGHYDFLLEYFVHNDSVAIDVRRARYNLENLPENNWHLAYATNWETASGGTNVYAGKDSLHLKLQDLVTADKIRIITIGTTPVNTKAYFGIGGCSGGRIATSVADNLYTIKNTRGQYLVVPVYTDTVTFNDSRDDLYPKWVTLDDYTDPNQIPAYQWIVEKTRKSDPDNTSPIRITNREFGVRLNNLQLTTAADGVTLGYGYVKADGFNAVPDAEKANPYLGYKYVDKEMSSVYTYVFNYLNTFAPEDASLYLGVNSTATDSLMYVGGKTEFQIIPMADEPTAYGAMPSYRTGAFEKIAQLVRNSYMLKIKDANKLGKSNKVLVVDQELRYSITDSSHLKTVNPLVGAEWHRPNGIDTAIFYLKTNNSKDGVDYYAMLDTNTFTPNWSYDATLNDVVVDGAYNNKLWMVKAGVNETSKRVAAQNQKEERTSAFAIEINDDPLYRRFNTTKEGTEASDKPDTVKFFRMNEPADQLYEDSYSKYSHPVNPNAPKDQINFLGVQNAEQYKNKNYAIYVDTAFVARPATKDSKIDTPKPQYMLVMGPEIVPPGTYCPVHGVGATCGHQVQTEGFVYGRYLINATDSAKNFNYTNPNASTIRDERYIWDTKWERLVFVNAIHKGDTLYLLKEGFDLKEGQLITNEALEKISYHVFDLGNNYHKDCVFSFRLIGKEDNFLIESETTGRDIHNGLMIAPFEGGWVKVQNGVPVISRDAYQADITEAEKWNVKKTDEAPLANDEITVGDDAFSVVAGIGSVTVKNAAGSKVTISNILGQTVASEAITNDNYTISVPAGIVVVAVEGEAAVKAIVK